MWIRITLQPWWARALIWSLIAAVVFAVAVCVRWLAGVGYADSWEAIARLGAGAVIFGLVAATTTRGRHKAYISALDGLSSRDRSAAIDASSHGSAPADARVRDAAIRVGEIRLAGAHRWKRIWLFLMFLAVLSLVLNAVGPFLEGGSWTPTDPASAAIVAALCLCATVSAWYRSRRVSHRIKMLRGADFGEAAVGSAG
jgi:hypothetical protein